MVYRKCWVEPPCREFPGGCFALCSVIQLILIDEMASTGLTHLKNAIESDIIYAYRGKNDRGVAVYQKVEKADIYQHFKGLFLDLAKKGRILNPEARFGFLRDQNTRCTEEFISQTIKKYSSRSMACITFDSHPQVRYLARKGVLTKRSKATDGSKQKKEGEFDRFSIAAYVLDLILLNSSSTDELLAKVNSLLSDELTSQTSKQTKRRVAAHLCKKMCIRHAVMSDDSVNKANDYCPGLWLVENKEYDFCNCFKSAEVKCLAPGPYFDPSTMKEHLEAMLSIASPQK